MQYYMGKCHALTGKKAINWDVVVHSSRAPVKMREGKKRKERSSRRRRGKKKKKTRKKTRREGEKKKGRGKES